MFGFTAILGKRVPPNMGPSGTEESEGQCAGSRQSIPWRSREMVGQVRTGGGFVDDGSVLLDAIPGVGKKVEVAKSVRSRSTTARKP